MYAWSDRIHEIDGYENLLIPRAHFPQQGMIENVA